MLKRFKQKYSDISVITQRNCRFIKVLGNNYIFEEIFENSKYIYATNNTAFRIESVHNYGNTVIYTIS